MAEDEVEMKDEEEMIEDEAIEVDEDHMAQMHEIIAALDVRVKELEAVVFGYEAKFEALSKFENIATEAIDTLASNTVSNFKPEARVESTPTTAKGSIFSQLKNKRGL